VRQNLGMTPESQSGDNANPPPAQPPAPSIARYVIVLAAVAVVVLILGVVGAKSLGSTTWCSTSDNIPIARLALFAPITVAVAIIVLSSIGHKRYKRKYGSIVGLLLIVVTVATLSIANVGERVDGCPGYISNSLNTN